MRSCSDLKLPVVFVTLLSQDGYLRQVIDPTGGQTEEPDSWTPMHWAQPLGAKMALCYGTSTEHPLVPNPRRHCAPCTGVGGVDPG